MKELKEEVSKKVREIKSQFVNGSLELADAVDEITLKGDNIDKFINNCVVEGIALQSKFAKGNN